MDYEHVIIVLSQKLKLNKKLFLMLGELPKYLQSDNAFNRISRNEFNYTHKNSRPALVKV